MRSDPQDFSLLVIPLTLKQLNKLFYIPLKILAFEYLMTKLRNHDFFTIDVVRGCCSVRKFHSVKNVTEHNSYPFPGQIGSNNL